MTPRVIFVDEGHKYILNDGSGLMLESVSGVTDIVKEKFDPEMASILFAAKDISKKVYDEYKKVYGYGEQLYGAILEHYHDDMLLLESIAESYKIKWNRKGKNSASKGTRAHNKKEKESIDKGKEINPSTGNKLPVITWEMQYDNESLESLDNISDGCYNEMIVWNEDFEICGTPDRIFKEGNKIWIRDWKTDEELNFESFYWRGKGFMTLFEPLNHMPKSNLSIYSVKMSLYGYMLELHGYEVQSMHIDHLIFKDKKSEEVKEVKEIELPYKRFEAEILVDAWMKKKK